MLKSALSYINSIPFPLTVKHYFAFSDSTKYLKGDGLSSSESWDVLRESHPHFSIADTREEWIKVNELLIKKDGQDGGLKERAKDVAEILKNNNIKSVFSAGCGGAGLEYHLKKILPEIRLTCSEYSKVAVERLSKVFLECDSIILFDMKSKDWSVANNLSNPKENLILLYRIDIDLSDEDMKDMFHNMHKSGIENVLIILCGRLTLRGLANRFYQRFLWRLKGTPYSFSGYLRSERKFIEFFDGFYKFENVVCEGLHGFLLKKNNVV